jgi:hypothetical protein
VLSVVLLIAYTNPLASTPLFTYDSAFLVSVQRCKREAEKLKVKMTSSNGQFKINDVQSGSFSARTARSPNTRLTWHIALAAIDTQ